MVWLPEEILATGSQEFLLAPIILTSSFWLLLFQHPYSETRIPGQASERPLSATVLAYPVTDPERYALSHSTLSKMLSVLKRSKLGWGPFPKCRAGATCENK
jgi:hypothetical protein